LASVRQKEQPVVVTAELPDIPELYQQAKEEKFDLLMLDCPPYRTEEVLEISRIADCTLLPVPPGFPELQSLSKFIDVLDCTYFVVLNLCVPDSDDADSVGLSEVRQMLEDHNIPLSLVHISRLEAFSDALNMGIAISEYEKEGEASGQIEELLDWVRSSVGLSKKI
jgi:cellulose biosynthesis protein BcsQ